MNLIIHEGISAESTDECVDLLNEYKIGNWKRKSKFTLVKRKDYIVGRVVRIFSDGEETVSVISVGMDDMTIICKNLDLREHKDLIKEIQKQADKHYTHDYGEIFFNPYTMKLHIVGGDGGIFYSEKSKKEVGRSFFSGSGDLFYEEGDINFNLPTIKEIEYADEYFPKIYNGEDDDLNIEDCFIEIGKINDVCSLDDFDYSEMYNNNPTPNQPSPQINYYQPKEKTIPELERELQRAIDKEDFETCARIRDEIKKLKGE
jgi:hypothetical protein